ncbi:MAG: DMT family transporter, partial [Mycobacteriales bacterium]
PPPGPGVWGALILTALAATALAFVVQTWAQSLLSPTRAAVIMTMEPVFAGIFGVAVAGERLGARDAAGAALVLAAMLLTEVGPRGGAEGEVRRLEV